MVTTSTIIGLFIETLSALAIPIINIILFKKENKKHKLFPIYVGALIFVVFAISLEYRPKLYLLSLAAIQNSTLLYLLTICSLAAIYEECGRLLAFKFILNKSNDKDDAIGYGLGHGGIEAILLVGINALSYLKYALMINDGTYTSLLNGLDQNTLMAMLSLKEQLCNLTLLECLYASIERFVAISIHLSLSKLAYMAVYDKHKFSYFFLALAFHFIANIPAALYQRKLLSITIVEILFALIAFLIYGFTNKRFKQFELNENIIDAEYKNRS